MTAPLPWIITVLVASEKGSRLSPPSTVRAPFTATGTSRATGCGLVGGSPGAAEPGRELVPEVASVSESLMIRDIARTPVKQNLRFAPLETRFPYRGYLFYLLLLRRRDRKSTRLNSSHA